MGSSISSPLRPPPPLPAGWTERWDTFYQRCYFLERKSGTIQWEHPQASGKNKSPVACQGVHSDILEKGSVVRPGFCGGHEHGAGAEKVMESQWAPPDDEIDQVDRIM